jgi:hypothetical protein
MSCRRLPSRHAPARWACALPRDTPGTPRPCRTHLSPLAQVKVPWPWRLSLSHAPSYLPPHAINPTTAPAAAPVAPPSPRQSWPGARRHVPDRCHQQQPPVSRLLPPRASQPPAHPPACRTHLLPSLWTITPFPCSLSLSHAPSYLPPHAINPTTAHATAPVAPPSPRQSLPGARRHAADRCRQQQPPRPGCFRRVPLSLPHTRPRAARTFCRRCRPLRPARAACRRTTRPCRTHRETCACPCPAAAAASLATVRFMEFARGGAKGHSVSVGGGGTMHASTRPGSRWRTCRCVHGQSPVWDAALQRPVIAETARESGNCQGESACWSRCCGEK